MRASGGATGCLRSSHLAFAMGTHERLGSGAGEGQGCLYPEMPGAREEDGGALWMEGGRVGGGRGEAGGGAADEGGVRDFSGVRICLRCTWGF